MLKRILKDMKRYLQIGLTLLLTFIVATACYDESEELQELCDKTGLTLERFEQRKGLRLHAVIRKI